MGRSVSRPQYIGHNVRKFFSASTVWTVPNGVYTCTATLWGGGAYYTPTDYGLRGGIIKGIVVPLTPGESINVIIGAGGTSTSLNGGDTSFKDIVAKGGVGGINALVADAERFIVSLLASSDESSSTINDMQAASPTSLSGAISSGIHYGFNGPNTGDSGLSGDDGSPGGCFITYCDPAVI